jgi:hypothetical protein
MSHVQYASVVGSLIYAMVCTRPYISHLVEVLSRYMSKPENGNSIFIKRVFKNLYGTINYGICCQGRTSAEIVLDIHGFVDAY